MRVVDHDGLVRACMFFEMVWYSPLGSVRSRFTM
jgi:hypothetical protein